MNTQTLAMISVLFIGFHSVIFGQDVETPRPLADSPVTVSPGSADALLVTEPCPTFSWGILPGAQGYEIVVLPFNDHVASPLAGGSGEMAGEVEPLIEVTLPANASSWTPSRDRCLDPGQSYAWYVRALGTGREEWSEGKAFAVGKPEAATDETRDVEKSSEKSNGTGGTPEVLTQIEIVQTMLAEAERRLSTRLDEIEGTVNSGNNRILANLVTIQDLVTPAPYETDVTICGILAGTAQAGLNLSAQAGLGGDSGAGIDLFGNGTTIKGNIEGSTTGTVGVGADATLNARVCVNFPVEALPELDATQQAIAGALIQSGGAVRDEVVDLAGRIGLGAQDLNGSLMSALSQLQDIQIPTNPGLYLAGAPEQLSRLVDDLPLNAGAASVVQQPSALIGDLGSFNLCATADTLPSGAFSSFLSQVCDRRLDLRTDLFVEVGNSIVALPGRVNAVLNAISAAGGAAGGFFDTAGGYFNDARDFFGF